MKWNVNPVVLISAATEPELQAPFIAILTRLQRDSNSQPLSSWTNTLAVANWLSVRLQTNCFWVWIIDIQSTIECGFTVKHVRDMIRTYSPINLFSGISWVNVLSCLCEWQILNNYAAKLKYYRQGQHLKIRYLRRFSHVLCIITTVEKSERLESLPCDFI